MDQEEMSRESTKELAEDRTDWAQQRTLLAKERTFAGWTRTGVACLAAGLAIARLIDVADATWIVRTIGFALIVTAGFVFSIGFLSYHNTLKKLQAEGVHGMSLWAIGVLTIGLLLSTILALILMFYE